MTRTELAITYPGGGGAMPSMAVKINRLKMGKTLRQLRLQQKLTLKQVASSIKYQGKVLRSETLRLCEVGERSFQGDLLESLAGYYKINTSELLEQADQMDVEGEVQEETNRISPIAYRRKELGLTQNQLAEIMGTTQGFITHLEVFRKKPSGKDLINLSKALRIPPEYLISQEKFLEYLEAKEKNLTTGQRIKERRESLGFNLENLSQKISIRAQRLKKLETDRLLPTLDEVVDLADALSVTTDYLMCKTPVFSDPLLEDFFSGVLSSPIEQQDLVVHMFKYLERNKYGTGSLSE